MSTGQIAALVVAATAFLTAAAHLLADVQGWMDRVRKTPIQLPSQALTGLPPAPPPNPSQPPQTR